MTITYQSWIVFALSMLAMTLTAWAEGPVKNQNNSVGIISSINGEAQVTRAGEAHEHTEPKFHGPVVYGDSISTSKDATVGLLVGQNSLLTMRELSEVRIAEAANNRRMLELAHGRVCVAVSTPGSSAHEPLIVKTPSGVVTAAPGTLFSVEVRSASKESARVGDPTIRLASTQVAERAASSSVETYQVIEGSIDIVSQASGGAATHLPAGQSLRILGGKIGLPFLGPLPTCRVQDVQIIPPHTTIPKAAQQTIAQDIKQTAVATPVAAMTTQASASQGSSSNTIPSGVIIPTTQATLNPPASSTTRTSISVRLP